MTEENRLYQVVLIWVRDAETWARYGRQVAATAAKYGWVERTIVPEEVYGDGVRLPDLLNIVYFDDGERGVAGWSRDPDFLEVVGLRSASIDMVDVYGVPERGDVHEDGLETRRYLVEFAQFGPGGQTAYLEYEREADSLMAPHGYHVERVIRPHGETALPFRPDVMKVAYFETADGFRRAQEAPGHARVENELYSAAVANSVWVVGRARSTAPRPGSG